MIRAIIQTEDESEHEQAFPAVPRVGEHLLWEPAGSEVEHTVVSVTWVLNGRGEPFLFLRVAPRALPGD